MVVDLFAGVPVSDFQSALPWYTRLLGGEPAFFPMATEAVWATGDHHYLYIVEDPPRAGRAIAMLLVEQLDQRLAELAESGLVPVEIESHPGGMRKAVFRDTDGNEIGFGGGPGV